MQTNTGGDQAIGDAWARIYSFSFFKTAKVSNTTPTLGSVICSEGLRMQLRNLDEPDALWTWTDSRCQKCGGAKKLSGKGHTSSFRGGWWSGDEEESELWHCKAIAKVCNFRRSDDGASETSSIGSTLTDLGAAQLQELCDKNLKANADKEAKNGQELSKEVVWIWLSSRMLLSRQSKRSGAFVLCDDSLAASRDSKLSLI